MALWGNTDVEGSKPKFVATADLPFTFFIDETEAQLKANKDKGINGAGWWLIKEHTDSEGTPRYKTELLVAMTTAVGVSGDAADDATVADIEAVITISGQPSDQNTSTGAATFAVTATVAPSGTVTYQWQKALASATRFVNVIGQTAASIILSGQTVDNTGDRYRVVITSTTGAVKVTSSAAELTFVD
tara:strand:- start:1687 stop:2250 length:564 start_codon:yes stop_codon:yes gene_type:complete